jgi:uncharacterized protein YecT (DUF1311 family)
MIRTAAALACFVILASPALAQEDKLDAAAAKTIKDCIRKAGADNGKREACIHKVAQPCLDRDDSRSTADINACVAREQKVWNAILNDTYKRLRLKLDQEQQVKLREMQRAWIASRDKTCAFYWDYFQGSMAAPMSIGCENSETARRALFLLGFLDDADGK